MIVTKEAYKLLEKSIVKWEKAHTLLVLEYGERFVGCGSRVQVNHKTVIAHLREDCPLCRAYSCCNCPIHMDTKKQGCSGTPYYNFTDCNNKYSGSSIGNKLIQKHLAMITYMEKLLKKCEVE